MGSRKEGSTITINKEMSTEVMFISYTKNYLEHDAIFSANAVLEFEMGSQPNEEWGSSDDELPPSMIDETF